MKKKKKNQNHLNLKMSKNESTSENNNNLDWKILSAGSFLVGVAATKLLSFVSKKKVTSSSSKAGLIKFYSKKKSYKSLQKNFISKKTNKNRCRFMPICTKIVKSLLIFQKNQIFPKFFFLLLQSTDG